jgi:hypothetical protein
MRHAHHTGVTTNLGLFWLGSRRHAARLTHFVQGDRTFVEPGRLLPAGGLAGHGQ